MPGRTRSKTRRRPDFEPDCAELEPRRLLAAGSFSRRSEPNLADAIPLDLGTPVIGRLSAHSAVYRFTLVDAVTFDPTTEPSTNRLDARVVAPGSDLSLSVLDASGRTLLESDGASATDRNGQIRLSLDPGIYYLTLAGSGPADESYTLNTATTPVFTTFPAFPSTGFAPDSQFGVADFNGDGHPDLFSTGGLFFGQGDGTFLLGQAGANTYSAVTVADFNGDGRPDVAMASDGISIQSVDPKDPSNTFSQAIDLGLVNDTSSPTGFRFRDIVSGDFNGDGIPDLAATSPYKDRILIALGVGGGGGNFAAPTWLDTPSFPFALTASDLNGDGRDDLIVTQPTLNVVSVFRSLGGGQFASPDLVPVGIGPIAVKAADLNQDHHPDLVVADTASSDVALLINRGDGTFAPAVRVSVGGVPLNVVVGDYNNDGAPDLATNSPAMTYGLLDPTITGLQTGNPSRDITMLLGHGDGRTFDVTRVSNFPASNGLGPGSIAQGDFDGDGRLDLVATAGAGGSVLLGRGDGSFRTVSHVRVGSLTTEALTGDFNNDGRPDIISVGGGSNDITVNLGRGDGNLSDPIRTEVAPFPYRIALGDFNHDGRLDFVATSLGSLIEGTGSAPGSIIIGLGRGDGTFLTRELDVPDGATPYAIAVGDFNGDGQLDLAVTPLDATDRLFVALGRSDGTFGFEPPVVGQGLNVMGVSGLASADLNRDGRADLVLVGFTGYAVLLGRADGTFDVTVNPDDGFLGFTPRLADLNGDGIPDLIADLTLDPRGLIAEGIGRGDGTFAPLRFFGTVGDFSFTNQSIGEGGVVGDFDGDGRPDFVAGLFNSDGTTAILHNLGNSDFERIPGPTFQRNSLPSELVAVDLNGDGRTDLVAVTYGSNDLPTFLNLGGFQFTDPFNGSAPIDQAPVLADLDGDGTPDLTSLNGAGAILWRRGDPRRPGVFDSPVVVNPDEPARSFAVIATPQGPRLAAASLNAGLVRLYARQNGRFSVVGSLTTGPLPAQVVVADLNNDGVPDLAVRNSGDDTVSLFRGGSAGGFISMGGFEAGLGTSDLAAADLDGDGLTDLLLTSKATGSVLVAPNLGNGTFGEVRPYRAGVGTRGKPIAASAFEVVTTEATSGLTLGRFGGTSGLDVIAVNPGPNTLGLLTNLGDGRLSNPRSIFTRSPTITARSADVNGDGFDDLVTLDAQGIQVFLGDGQGGFRLGFSQSSGPDPTGLSLADVNRDGRPDLLIGNAYGDVLTMIGVGDGRFRTDLGDAGRVTLAVADLNGDGRPDFVYSNTSRDRVAVDYSGTSQLDVRASGVRSPGQVTLADLNADGIPDLIVANTGGNNVLVYLGIGRGQFGPAVNGGLGFATGTGPVGVTVADVDGDGRPDLIVANKGSNDVSILLNRPTSGGFTFTPGPRLKAGQGPVATVYGPIGPGGIPALAVTDGGSNDVRLLTSLGNGFFNDQAPVVIPVGQAPSSLISIMVGGSMALVSINTGTNDLTLISGLDTFDRVVRTFGSGGISPVSAISFQANGFDGLVVANQGDGAFALFKAGDDGLDLIARSLSTALPSPSSLVLGGIDGGLVSLYATTEGRESASLLTFLLAGGSGSSPSSSTGGVVVGSQPLQALRDSALTILSTLLTLTIDDGASEAGNGSLARPTQEFLPTTFEPLAVEDPPAGPSPESRSPIAQEIEEWRRYLSGVDQALEDLRNEESTAPTPSPASESTPTRPPALPPRPASPSLPVRPETPRSESSAETARTWLSPRASVPSGWLLTLALAAHPGMRSHPSRRPIARLALRRDRPRV